LSIQNNINRNKSNSLLHKNNELIIVKRKQKKFPQARAALLSTVSHELRTPLNAINGGYPFTTGRERSQSYEKRTALTDELCQARHVC
jgi:signal transduction histidine kinase